MGTSRIVKTINPQKWAEFVQHHPQGNFFQTPEMFELYQETTHYRPLLFAALGENDEITGVLVAVIQKEHPGLVGYFSSRTVVWGGPLIEHPDPGTGKLIMGMLLTELYKTVRYQSIYIQFRNLFDMSRYVEEFQKYGYRFDEHLNFIVPTTARQETEKRISKSKMRQVKKSLRSGATMIEPQSLEQVEDFYRILKDMYRKKVKRPLPAFSFFKTFYRMSLDKTHTCRYFLIQYEGKIVGGIMCPITRGKVIYEWYICGLDGSYKGIYPSVLATWAPIDYALKNGLNYFDFMGAGKPNQDYGVRDFKAGFGGEQLQYGRFERINNRFLYRIGRIGLKIMGALRI